MSGALASSQWFRVAALSPRLRGHVRLHRHVYRGRVWHVLEDRVSGRQHRFNPTAYRVIRLFDGRHTLQSIWDELMADLQDDTTTQDEIVNLLGQLNASDLVSIDATPDVVELLERRDRHDRQRLASRLLNPLSLRFPLWDPDALLRRLLQWAGGIPAWLLMALWLLAVLPALVLLPPHWQELTHNFGDRLMSADNLWVLALSFPLLKAGHELAHGLAVRRYDGEVHEMGLMLLMFYPVPYVDASASNAFARKTQRMLVAAAGMLFEIWVASLAYFAWLLLEPGIPRSIAFNLMVVGGVSTVLFNANPLLRYDGYYMLADLIEVPNLGQRSNRHWQYLITRHFFGVGSATPPASLPGERHWLVLYAPVALVYRLFVTFGIAWFIAQHYFFVGVLLALWSLVAVVLVPLAKGVYALTTQPQFTSRTARVWGTLGSAAAVLLLALFALPLPHHTAALGVVWLPERALLRAGADGFVTRLLVAQGSPVDETTRVLETIEPSLQAKLRQQQARLREVQARLDAAWSKPAEAGRMQDDVHREEATLARLEDEQARLAVRPLSGGQLMLDQAVDLPGRFVHSGDVLGHVVCRHVPLVKVIVPQDQVEWVRSATREVQVRLPQDSGEVLAGRLVRAVPKASNELPSAALGQGMGGNVVVDPHEPKGTRSLDTVFEFDVEVVGLQQREPLLLGSRAYVSFEHAPEPIGRRWLRALRTQLLSHFRL